MFALRCLGVSLAIFVLVYGALSVVVARRWGSLLRLLAPGAACSTADFLFTLRVLPWLAGGLVTFLFTLPSFLLLEPRSTNEAVGTAPALLGLVCLAVLTWGIISAIRAQMRASTAMHKWLEGSTELGSESAVPVFRTGRNSPTLTVAGLCAPKVLVSEETLAALNPSELRAAIKHEIAHVRRYDNLKKMMFRVSPFPGMGKIEHVWAEQSELAADDAAVASRSDALDLASALIKVSKLATGQVPEVGAGLLHSSTALSVRVRRLFAWDENAISVKPSARWRYALTPAAVMVIWVCFSYGSILSRMHVLTEWLVR
jgi:hypothetical protein